MPIEFPCSSCGQTLRVPETAVGKRAKCPKCEAVNVVPASEPPAAQPPTAQPVSPAQPIPPAQPAAPSQPGFAAPPPEFSADTDNPFQSPSGSEAQRMPEDTGMGEMSHGSVEIGDAIGFAWNKVFNNLGICLLGVLAYIGVNIGISIINQILMVFLGKFFFAKGPPANVVAMLTPLIIMMLISIAITMIPIAWLMCGYIKFGLKICRGQQAEIADIFSGSKQLGSVIAISFAKLLITIIVIIPVAALATMLTGFAGIISVALIFYCILIYVFMLLMLAEVFVVDRGLNFMDAMKASVDYMKGNVLMTFLTFLVAGIAATFGIVLTCGLGYFVAIPFFGMLSLAIYLQTTGQLSNLRR